METKILTLDSYLFYPKAFKVFLFCCLLFCFNTSQSATYYFSSSAGNDQFTSSQARNAQTPWKTINKLNSFFIHLGSADSVLFKRGDIFDGAIIVTRSGAPFAPIYIGAYGEGKNPEISGFLTLTHWTSVGNGIYESPCLTDVNNLIINGGQHAMGRYPNKGYLSYESHNANNSITDNQLSAIQNWTGGEVVIRKNRWTIDKSLITDQSGGTITYAAGTKGVPTNGYGYFIQNNIKTVDQFGEWFFDENKKSMLVYFGSKNPDLYTVKTSSVSALVDIKGHNFITFENLSFVGAKTNAFFIKNSKNIIVKNCLIDFSGHEAILASYSAYLSVSNTLINHSLSGGINLDAGCIYASIINNTIKNTGLFPGMGKSGTGTYEGITSFGDFTQIEKNNLDSVGYNGIYFGGNSSYTKNNFINYFCLTKDDGAGIYIGDWSKTVNKKVSGNIVLNGIGTAEGTNSTSLQAEGIYIDDLTESVTVSDNTVSLCANNGIKIHNARNINVYSNTVYNNGVQLRLEQDHYLPTSTYVRNNNISNNIFFSKSDFQTTAKISSQQDDIAEFGKLDSNLYCKPLNEQANFQASIVKEGKGVNQSYNLSGWKSAYGKDQFSEAKITNSDDNMRFEYNASNQTKTLTLSKSYIDVYNNIYTNKVTIQPYSSVVLIAAEPSRIKGIKTSILANVETNRR